MKKLRCLRLIGLMSLFFIGIFLVNAQIDNIEGVVGDLERGKEKIDEGVDVLTDKESLFKEWTEFLEDKKIGKFVIGISDFFEMASPIFGFFIGVEYSLSWLFFLALLFWVVILVLVYRPLKEVGQIDGGLAFLIAIVVATLAGRSGGIRLGLNLFLLPLFENPWVILFAFLITIFLLVLYVIFLKKTGKSIREMIKKNREERREYRERIKDRIEEDELKARGIDI